MSELKIQLGCGGNILEGWTNHDSDVDITKPLPWEANTVDMILLEHVLEHVNTHHALLCLMECCRILKPSGRLRLCIPVLDRLDIEHGRDIVFGHGHQAAYTTGLVRHFLRLAGFRRIDSSFRKPCDGHWKIIGEEKDDVETARLEAIK